MAAGIDTRKIEVIDLMVERDMTDDERHAQIMLQGYVKLAGFVGVTGQS